MAVLSGQVASNGRARLCTRTWRIMKKVDVLVLNFDIENSIQPWVDRGILYAIYTARKVEDIKQFYGQREFGLIFLRISEGLAEGFRTLNYLKDISPHSKILVVSEDPTFYGAFWYTKYGVFDFRGPFEDLFEFMNALRSASRKSSLRSFFDSLEVKLTGLSWNGNLLSLSTAIADTALACLLRAKGEYETLEHLNGVSQYALLIVEKLRKTTNSGEIFSRNYTQYLYLGSQLHDIGKINIPEKIVMKPSSLTQKEFEVVKTHTHYGYEILAMIEQGAKLELGNFFKIGKEMALFHHENYDGTGYPYGLKAKDIPLSARICALADSYSALASNRPFRKALSHERICELILQGRFRKYDPDILKVFRQSNREFRQIYEVFKKNAETYPDKKIRKQCAWCKSLFLFNKWLPYNEFVYGSHALCPKCAKRLQKSVTGISGDGIHG